MYRDAGVGHADRRADRVRPGERSAGWSASSRRCSEPARPASPRSAIPGTRSRRSRWARSWRARGHEVTLETWSRWQEAVEREGMRFAAAPEYQVFPTQRRSLKPYVAAVRASGSTRELIRECDPEVVVADIITVGGVAGGAGRGAAVGHADPARDADGRARASRSTRSARSTRARRSGGGSGAGAPARDEGRGAGPRGAERGARAAWGCRRCRTRTAGSRASSRSWRRFPQLEYPRAERLARACGSPGRCCGSSRSATSSCRRATSRSCWWRRARRRTRSRQLLRAALEGLADEPVRVLATTNRRPPPEPLAGAGERAARRLGLLRADDAAAATRSSATPATERSRGRWPAACRWSRAGHAGDMAENAARIRWAGVGVSLPRRFQTPRGRAPGGAPPARRPALPRAAREELRDWAAAERRRRERRGRGRGARRGARAPQKPAKSGLM